MRTLVVPSRLLAAVIATLAISSSLLSASADAASAFLWLPLDGARRISQYVDDSWTRSHGLPTYQGHNGTDYYAARGSAVYAAAAGTVIRADDGFLDRCARRISDNSGLGNVVYIRHTNGYVTRYLHLQPGSLRVRVNQSVEAGAQIAATSNTGNTQGSDECSSFYHLHFEVRDAAGSVVNPYGSKLWVTDPPGRFASQMSPQRLPQTTKPAPMPNAAGSSAKKAPTSARPACITVLRKKICF